MVKGGKPKEWERLLNELDQAAGEWSEAQKALDEQLKAHEYVPGEQVIIDGLIAPDPEVKRLETQANATHERFLLCLKRLRTFCGES